MPRAADFIDYDQRDAGDEGCRMSALDAGLDALPAAAPQRQERLVDAWRLNAAMVDQDMIFIGSHTRTLARRGKMMSDGKPMHSERYLAQIGARTCPDAPSLCPA